MRFALMEAKVALAQLILAVDLKLAPGRENLEFENSPFLMRPKNGVMLLLTPLKNEWMITLLEAQAVIQSEVKVLLPVIT